MNHLADLPERRLATAPVLVGREREQAVLGEELASAIDGRGGLVLIAGEAGIGKTTLARDLLREAGRRQVQVLVGHCYDLTNTPPYGPWLDLFTGSRASDRPAPPAAFAGGRLAGTITDQAALFAEVHEFFAAATALCPTLVVLEDLHWADPASIELLRYLTARIGSHPLLVIATYRVDELTRSHPFYQQLPALIRETDAVRLDLHRLDTSSLHAFAAAHWALPAADEARLVAYLEAHGEGHPFFSAELLRALQEAGLLRREADRSLLAAIDGVVMPSLLRQVIDGRVACLGEATRRPLAIAAVIGQEVPLDLWAEVAALDEEVLLGIVEAAIEAHLLEAEGQGARVRFVHALIREALYDGIASPRRRAWHRRVATTLATAVDADPDAVAYHFQEAGDHQAVEWLIQAGDRAQRAYAWLTASERFGAAAAMLANVPGSERQRAWLFYRFARLQRFSRPAAGVAALAAVERLAVLGKDSFLAADARYSRGLVRCYAGDFGLGLIEMEAGLDMLDALPADQGRPADIDDSWLADVLPAGTLAGRPAERADAGIGTGMRYRRGGSIPYFVSPGGWLREAREVGEFLHHRARHRRTRQRVGSLQYRPRLSGPGPRLRRAGAT